ncbi:hypothetical protein LSH36_344g02007 [Paralvinella palmiformis]|uniref:Uncharacterized protein n=1 Tax=Paralvinella palmiformis TaxID=53620 RepID=A0AAD9N1U8_9ANNE|nr:hypothetical protein LSH36_344g02007 [Paralvinella palmiformis]
MMGGTRALCRISNSSRRDKWWQSTSMKIFILGVVWVLSEDNGEINFMEKAKQVIKGREVFRWPSRTDQCEISRGYVFAVSILLHPSSSSGRTFFVTTPENLSTMYTNFKRSLDWKCSVHIFLFIIFFQSS